MEPEILMDMETVDLGRRRLEILRRYGRAVEKRMQAGPAADEALGACATAPGASRLGRESRPRRRCNNSPARNTKRAAQHDAQRLAVKVMLLTQNPRRERFHRIPVKNRNRRLQNDRPRIKFFIHEMNRAARDLHAMFERLMLRVQTGKCGQKGRMNVQDPIGILPDEGRAQ
jgi:hypothetical protein